MDTVLEKKKGIQPKHWIIALLSGLFLLLIGTIFYNSKTSSLKVDKNNLSIVEVIQGEFNDFISISGSVKPISTVFIDVQEGGRVVEKFIEEGSMVQKGDVILKLENNGLFAEILASENNLATKQNSLRETKINFESAKIVGQKDLLDVEYRLLKSKRKYEQNKSLYSDDLIAKEDYLNAKEDYELDKKNYEVSAFKVRQDSLLRVSLMIELDKDLGRMKKTLGMVYERIEQLNVKALVDGQLGMLDAEIGQRLGRGSRIGQINVLTNYKIEAYIDEYYIDRVNRNLTGTYERGGISYTLRLKKIYPEVRGGQFRVDLVFTTHKPNQIRTGQSYYIKLQLGAPSSSLLLSRGGFFQSTGGQWVYVVDPSGDFATKRNIRIGKQNPEYYELLEGLSSGEQVISSSYDNFGDNDKLILK